MRSTEKRRKRMPVNQNAKGKRVERALAAWLRARGVTSARRSEQYSGHSKFGDSDIVADELPSFHLECKGTALTKVAKALLKKWWKQIWKDALPGKLPVIFHLANRCVPVCLVPKKVLQEMEIYASAERHVVTDSVTVIEHAGPCLVIDNLFSGGTRPKGTSFFLTGIDLAKEGLDSTAVLYIFDGEVFLEHMKRYDSKVRLDKAAS